MTRKRRISKDNDTNDALNWLKQRYLPAIRPMLILQELKNEPHHSFALAKLIRTKYDPIVVTEALLPLLKQLSTYGLISKLPEVNISANKIRKPYAITAAGQQYLLMCKDFITQIQNNLDEVS